jgi:ferredoxin-NADP reductase
MMKVEDGSVPAKSQKGLKPALVAQQHFLACACFPEEDIAISLPDAGNATSFAVISRMHWFNEGVMGLWLRPDQTYAYEAGQFLRLYKDGSQKSFRCYSLASVPAVDDELFLNIRWIADGEFSNWICEGLSVGDEVEISESIGSTFYTSKNFDQKMLLIATGSGLGALYGVACDALFQGHIGEIHLYHGVRDPKDLYLEEELLSLGRRYPNFKYYPCVSGGASLEAQISGRALDIAIANHQVLDDWAVYLCGNPGMVHAGKRRAYLNGASLQDIYGDPFGA